MQYSILFLIYYCWYFNLEMYTIQDKTNNYFNIMRSKYVASKKKTKIRD